MEHLTPKHLSQAQRMNVYYQARLGWPASMSDKPPQADQTALHIAKSQRASGYLVVDGILGPKTRAHMRGEIWSPSPKNYFIVNQRRIPTDLPVVTFEQSEGLSFYDLPVWQMRTEPSGQNVDLLVLHWDECVSSHQCFYVLLQRGLSVHLMLDADGTIYQALDLAHARAWHARQANERSIGIEIQNALRPQDNTPLEEARTWVEEILPHTDTLWRHFDFTKAQKDTLKRLAPQLCKLFQIPLQLPLDAQGQVLTGLCALPYQGICGHYHLQTDKVDPGLSLWPELQPICRAQNNT